MTHETTLERQIVELSPQDGWRRVEAGTLARVTCLCGIDTGWIEIREADRIYKEHSGDPRPMGGER